ncbi:MAG: transposase [Candidatus Thorarchaeota archaeon]|jgi:transposase
MMGYQSGAQQKLFHYNVNLEQRVPQQHILRRIKEKVDFDFIYGDVKDAYGANGNVSVPPPVILKMMLLLILYNVRSERELMSTIPLRLDWLWFLGYDLDGDIPHHSVLSKARTRWGVKAFKRFFERIVWRCVEVGLVEGEKLFLDASLIDAHASNNSVFDTKNLKRYVDEGYTHLEARLDYLKDEKTTPTNSRYISSTDPDASVVRQGSGRSKLRYKTHRGVDPTHEVITATTVTTGSASEGDLLKDMVKAHEENTHTALETVVADSKYGTIDNFLLCHDLRIKAHIPSLEETQRGSGRKKGIFPKEAFTYDAATDTFTCPIGHLLRRHHYRGERRHYEYRVSPEICHRCELKAQCTRAQGGRTLKRHARQDELDTMRACAHTREAKKDLKTRQHLSERSFARSTRHGYKRARWRRLWRMKIQDFLIAIVHNIQLLITHGYNNAKSNVHALRAQRVLPSTAAAFFRSLSNLLRALWHRVHSLYFHAIYREPTCDYSPLYGAFGQQAVKM